MFGYCGDSPNVTTYLPGTEFTMYSTRTTVLCSGYIPSKHNPDLLRRWNHNLSKYTPTIHQTWKAGCGCRCSQACKSNENGYSLDLGRHLSGTV